MKKVAVILFAALVFAFGGCKDITKELKKDACGAAETNAGVAFDMSEILFIEGVWTDDKWKNADYFIEKDCVPNGETAIRVTSVLIERFQQESLFIGYAPQSVFFDTKDNIWIVTYAESTKYPSACVSIAVRKENAEVLKIWLGE